MKELTPRTWLYRLLVGVYFGVLSLLAACTPSDNFMSSSALNSRFTDEQPALSGNGRLLAFVSNRDGRRRILLYDLQLQQFMSLPNLNRIDTVAESPSLSYTGRYITYLTSDQGKPVLVLYDRATQQPQVLSQAYQGWVRNPSISPDGRYIVFESSNRGQWDTEVLDRGSNVELDLPEGATIGG